MLNLKYNDGATAVSGDQLIVPAADLDGISDSYMSANSQTKELDANVVASSMDALWEYISNNDTLGLAASKPNPTGSGTDLINQTYSLTSTLYADFSNGTQGVLPLNSNNFGAVNISNIFPSLEKAADGSTPSTGGVEIPYTAIGLFDFTPDFASFDPAATDNRAVIHAIADLFFEGMETRTGSVASAVTAKARNNPTGVGAPANVVSNTSLDSDALTHTIFANQTISATIQWSVQQNADGYSVNVNVSTS